MQTGRGRKRVIFQVLLYREDGLSGISVFVTCGLKWMCCGWATLRSFLVQSCLDLVREVMLF